MLVRGLHVCVQHSFTVFSASTSPVCDRSGNKMHSAVGLPRTCPMTALDSATAPDENNFGSIIASEKTTSCSMSHRMYANIH